jgi:hypothetical protein
MVFIEPMQSALEITAERAFGGDFESFPLEDLDLYFTPLIEWMPQLSSVMYAHDDGYEYMLLEADGRWESRLTRPESWGAWEAWREWGEHDEEKPIKCRELDYDSRQRPWHLGAVNRLAELGELNSPVVVLA